MGHRKARTPLKPKDFLPYLHYHTNTHYTFLKKVMLPMLHHTNYRGAAAKFCPIAVKLGGAIAKNGRGYSFLALEKREREKPSAFAIL